LLVAARKLRRRNVTRFFTCAAIVIGLGATATLAITGRTVNPNATAEVRFAADGAFRDGLYLGKLVAEGGQPATSRHRPLVHRSRPHHVHGGIPPRIQLNPDRPGLTRMDNC